MLFFLQINRCCCGFFLTMLPYRVISNALLFPFTLSQSIYPLSGYCLASLPIRIVPLNVPIKVDLSLPLPPPLLLISPPLVLPPVPPEPCVSLNWRSCHPPVASPTTQPITTPWLEGRHTAGELDGHITTPAALPWLVAHPSATLAVKRSTLHQTLAVSNAPPVKVFSVEVGVPVNVPFLSAPSACNPLIDNPLAIPYACVVAQGVESVAVGIASPRHIQHPAV